jgi:hypothetical protein
MSASAFCLIGCFGSWLFLNERWNCEASGQSGHHCRSACSRTMNDTMSAVLISMHPSEFRTKPTKERNHYQHQQPPPSTIFDPHNRIPDSISLRFPACAFAVRLVDVSEMERRHSVRLEEDIGGQRAIHTNSSTDRTRIRQALIHRIACSQCEWFDVSLLRLEEIRDLILC